MNAESIKTAIAEQQALLVELDALADGSITIAGSPVPLAETSFEAARAALWSLFERTSKCGIGGATREYLGQCVRDQRIVPLT